MKFSDIPDRRVKMMLASNFTAREQYSEATAGKISMKLPLNVYFCV
jgi:phage-related protein